MRVLVACEFSGIVRDAFIDAGHDAWSCDLEACESDNGPHIQNDVLEVLDNWWDLMVMHAPCTYLTNSGVRHLHEQGSTRWVAMFEAARFFNALMRANIPKICGENPVPHGYAQDLIGKYDQVIQPWQFGHGEIKKTCLWLKNLPPLLPTNIVGGRESRIHRMAPGPDRSKERSRFYPGIAAAMAQQWGGN